ncbi:MAG: hypothetical protein ACR2OM_12500, partial [Aestuariivirgaceae bacterium]
MTGNTVDLAVPQTGFSEMAWAGIRAHGLLIAVVAVYYAANLYFIGAEPLSFITAMAVSTIFGIAMILFAVFMVRFIQIAIYVKPEKPIKAIAKDMWSLMSDRRRLAVGLPMIAILAPFITIYGEFKATVSVANGGFLWDTTFNDWDRWMHFG